MPLDEPKNPDLGQTGSTLRVLLRTLDDSVRLSNPAGLTWTPRALLAELEPQGVLDSPGYRVDNHHLVRGTSDGQVAETLYMLWRQLD